MSEPEGCSKGMSRSSNPSSSRRGMAAIATRHERAGGRSGGAVTDKPEQLGSKCPAPNL